MAVFTLICCKQKFWIKYAAIALRYDRNCSLTEAINCAQIVKIEEALHLFQNNFKSFLQRKKYSQNDAKEETFFRKGIFVFEWVGHFAKECHF